METLTSTSFLSLSVNNSSDIAPGNGIKQKIPTKELCDHMSLRHISK